MAEQENVQRPNKTLPPADRYTGYASVNGETVWYFHGTPQYVLGSRRSNQESQPAHPGFLRSDGTRDYGQRPLDSVQGTPRVDSVQGQSPVGSVQGNPPVGSVQGQPSRVGIQGGGHFGK